MCVSVPSHTCVFMRSTLTNRYLFCKERLLAGSEFAVLDLMDELEAGARSARDRDRAKARRNAEEVGRSVARFHHITPRETLAVLPIENVSCANTFEPSASSVHPHELPVGHHPIDPQEFPRML